MALGVNVDGQSLTRAVTLDKGELTPQTLANRVVHVIGPQRHLPRLTNVSATLDRDVDAPHRPPGRQRPPVTVILVR
jgi:hypothetical protein